MDAVIPLREDDTLSTITTSYDPAEVTKVNERRIIPMCDALIERLQPWRNSTGTVCTDKVPQREIEILVPKVKKEPPEGVT